MPRDGMAGKPGKSDGGVSLRHQSWGEPSTQSSTTVTLADFIWTRFWFWVLFGHACISDR